MTTVETVTTKESHRWPTHDFIPVNPPKNCDFPRVIKSLKTWIKNLRSGNYKQTTGKMQDANGRMCCLGVWADCTVSADWETNSFGKAYHIPEYTDYDQPLPRFFSAVLGNSFPELFFTSAYFNMDTLMHLNDDHRWSFSQIASYIELFILLPYELAYAKLQEAECQNSQATEKCYA